MDAEVGVEAAQQERSWVEAAIVADRAALPGKCATHRVAGMMCVAAYVFLQFQTTVYYFYNG